MSFEVVVDADGRLFLQTRGFKGPACLEEARRLLALLKEAGVETENVEVRVTEEYYAGREKAQVRA
ncbi:MAG: hypothetical protein QW587_04815 [Candidatus Bathyarchaeia archaeon]